MSSETKESVEFTAEEIAERDAMATYVGEQNHKVSTKERKVEMAEKRSKARNETRKAIAGTHDDVSPTMLRECILAWQAGTIRDDDGNPKRCEPDLVAQHVPSCVADYFIPDGVDDDSKDDDMTQLGKFVVRTLRGLVAEPDWLPENRVASKFEKAVSLDDFERTAQVSTKTSNASDPTRRLSIMRALSRRAHAMFR